MFVSTRLLKVANSRSLRPLSFVSTLQYMFGQAEIGSMCLCVFVFYLWAYTTQYLVI